MRVAMFAAAGTLVLLAACGGPQTSQANNAQANISNDSRDANAAAASTATNTTALLAAAPSKDEALKIMHERHEGMEAIGKSAKAIKRELDASSPDLGTVRSSAAKIADLSQKANGWFAKGTGPELGKTGAKSEIWQNPQDFAAKLAAWQKEAQAFNAAASGNDVGVIKAKFGELGQSCKACHDKFRSEMHH